MDVIEGKWKPIILFALKGGPRRYGELRREVPEAAQKVLTYSMTSYGRTLMPILSAMAGWGKRHRAVVMYRSEEDENLRSSVGAAEGAGAAKRE